VNYKRFGITLFAIAFIICGIYTFLLWPKPNLKPFGQPKYFNHFYTTLEPTFFDYHQALKVAKANDRLLLVSFTGHGCVSDRNVLAWPTQYWLSRNFIQNKMVYFELYVDDKQVVLDSAEWFTDPVSGRLNTTLAKKNSRIQANNYDSNAQPFHALINPENEETIATFGYAPKNENTKKLLKAYYLKQ
jgi:hypothetical protein